MNPTNPIIKVSMVAQEVMQEGLGRLWTKLSTRLQQLKPEADLWIAPDEEATVDHTSTPIDK